MNGEVRALTYWNGSLVIAGQFSAIGLQPIRGIARWDGHDWQPIGTSILEASVLAVWRGKLIAAANGTLLQWNDPEWEPVVPDLNGYVTAIAANDTELVVAGYMGVGYTAYQNRVGKWNGSTWTAMGDSISIYPYAIASYQGEWYVGGSIYRGPEALLQRWNGSAWQSVADVMRNGTEGGVLAMTTFHDELVVAGFFDSVNTVPASGISRWNGSAWSALPGALSDGNTAFSLAAGGDSVLHVGCTSGLQRWDGISMAREPGPAWALALGCDGPRLAAAGSFDQVEGRTAVQLAERGSGGWEPLESWAPPMHGLADPSYAEVDHFVRFGDQIVASGRFSVAADDHDWVRVGNVAGWDGAHWRPIGYLTGYEDLVMHDGALYAFGSDVRRWSDREGWEPISDNLYAFTGASFGGALYGGSFSWYPASAGSLLRWNSSTWDSLPRPAGLPDTAGIRDLVVHDAALVALWHWPGNCQLLSWDGSAWTSISGLLPEQAGPLASWNGRLYAANFGAYYGDSALMYREAGTWHSTGLTGPVTAMTPFGPWLAVGGVVGWSGGTTPGPIVLAVWDGASWMPLPSPPGGLYANIQALLGDGHSLWVGGIGLYSSTSGALSRWDWDGFAPGVPTDALTLAPNPFQTSTVLRFSLAHAGTVKLSIFDIAGHEVARLWNGFIPGGVHALPWDGTDRHGRRAPSGMYFGKLVIDGGKSQSQRIALIR